MLIFVLIIMLINCYCCCLHQEFCFIIYYIFRCIATFYTITDDIANVHYGFSVTAGAVLTMPTKLNKQTANASYSAQDISSKADVADPKLSSIRQPSKSVIAKTASIISHVKESFAHLKNPKVIQGTLAKAKQLSSNGTEVQTMALSHEVS